MVTQGLGESFKWLQDLYARTLLSRMTLGVWAGCIECGNRLGILSGCGGLIWSTASKPWKPDRKKSTVSDRAAQAQKTFPHACEPGLRRRRVEDVRNPVALCRERKCGAETAAGRLPHASTRASSASRSRSSTRWGVGSAIKPSRFNAVKVRQTVSIVRPR